MQAQPGPTERAHHNGEANDELMDNASIRRRVATDFGPSFYGAPDSDGRLVMPFLQNAQNVFFELDGGPHKIGGTTAFNGTATGASDNITGLFDYWRMGTTYASTQKRMAFSNGTLYADNGSGGFTSIKAGLSATGVPSFSVFDDICIFSTDTVGEVPQSYDQTTEANLAGSPPAFAFSAKHKNKVFAAGVPTLPSRLYYCVDGNPENWTGSGSGSIDIDPDDGDRIVGIASHKDSLWVFKGPYKGSIHRITGSSPTGADAYARITFIEGLTTVYHNMIFRFGDDLGFMSPNGTIHSLNATAQYGDFIQSFLSLPIDTYVRTELNLSRLKFGWAVNDPTRGHILFTVPGAGQTNNNIILCMDYRFGIQPPRWSRWTAFGFGSLAMMRDSGGILYMHGGDYIGKVWKMNQSTRSHNSASIAMAVKTPAMTYGNELVTKTIEGASLGVAPKNNNNITFGWQADNNTEQTVSIAQGAGSSVLDTMVLDTDTLGVNTFVPRFSPLGETGGDGRSFTYQITDSINSSDCEVHNIGTKITPTGESWEN